jgi:hypothetical protein
LAVTRPYLETIKTGSTAHSHDKQGAVGACCAESATYTGLMCLSPLNDLGRRDNIRPLSEQAIEKTGVQFRVAVRASVTDNQNTVVLVHRLQCRREHNAAGDDPEQNERVYVFRPEQNLQVSSFKSTDAGLCNVSVRATARLARGSAIG